MRTDPEKLWLRRLVAPVRRRVAVAAVLEAVSAAAQIVPVVAVVEIARHIVRTGEPGSAVWWWTFVAALGLVLALASGVVGSLLAHLADADLGLVLRSRIARHLARLPLGWFSSPAAGRVQSVIQDDVAGLHEDVAHAQPELVGSITSSLTIIAYLLYVDWRLALITLGLVTVGQLIRRRLGAAIMQPFSQVAAAAGRMSAAAVELVHGVVESKVFSTPGGQSGAARHFRRAADEFIEIDDRMTKTFATKRAFTRATVAAPTVTLVVLATTTALERGAHVDPVDVVAFLLLGLALFDSSADLYFYVVFPALRLQVPAQRKGPAMAGRIGSLLDERPMSEPDPPVKLPPPSAESAGRTVRFADVDFTYDGERNVLQRLSLTLKPGTVTALVGPSGAGKSTVGQLLARFYDVSAGSITIDGIPLDRIATTELYRTVGLVFQDVQLLRDSIRTNLTLGRPEASFEEIEAAARAAAIHDRISKLPDGYDTVIGEGISLSGGERQRLSIARTLLADTPVLVLDEATSSADPESEADIQDALSALTRDRTVLVIAHRLRTITGADSIAVLESGSVVEQGTHRELLQRHGSYAALWDAQKETALTGAPHKEVPA